MSKCECCKEENSDLITYKGYKMCPTCYMGYVRKVKVCENNAKYETEIDQLKQQLAEKDKEIAHLKEKDNYHLRYELAGADETITNLKEQLAEKDCRIEELEGQFAYECECNKQLVELQKQLEKKQNEIAELEQELTELKEKVIARPKFKHFEEYWYIENNPYCDNELQVFNGKVMEIICAYDEDWLYEYRFDTSCRYIEENMIFTTLEEAQAKLQELRNGDFSGEC